MSVRKDKACIDKTHEQRCVWTNKSACVLCVLIHFNCVAFKCKDIVGEDDDFVVALFVELDEELTDAKLVWVHDVQQLR